MYSPDTCGRNISNYGHATGLKENVIHAKDHSQYSNNKRMTHTSLLNRRSSFKFDGSDGETDDEFVSIVIVDKILPPSDSELTCFHPIFTLLFP